VIGSLRPGRHLACLLKGSTVLAAWLRLSGKPRYSDTVAPHDQAGAQRSQSRWMPERGGDGAIMIFGFQNRWSILLTFQYLMFQYLMNLARWNE
jgi:hypothetical protein